MRLGTAGIEEFKNIIKTQLANFEKENFTAIHSDSFVFMYFNENLSQN
jgi:hypothetical protein